MQALKNTLNKPLLHTYTYASEERINYLNYLIENTPDNFEKAFLLSAGTEATEAALKLMRLNGIKKDKKIWWNNLFQWQLARKDTWCSNDARVIPKEKEWIGYNDPNIYHLDFPYPWITDNPVQFFSSQIEKLINENNIDPENDLCGFYARNFSGVGSIILS